MHILIDGLNLALAKGTGVATYARGLAGCVRLGGHEVSVLYGRNVPRGRTPLVTEAAFFDAQERRARSRLRAVLDTVRSLAPLAAYAVPRTGLVLREGAEPKPPAGAGLFNHASLFQKAQAKFDAGFGITEVTLPSPVDVAHWTYPLPLRVRGARNVYTIHDMVPLKLPYATLDRKARHHRLLRRLCASADAVVTVSETSRRDILAMLPVDPAKVINTYQSVAPPPAAAEEEPQRALDAVVEAAFASGSRGPRPRVEPGGYFLFVGAIEPKKNLRRLIEAYLAAGLASPLLVVGRKAWAFEEEERLLRASPRILHLDHLPRGQVTALLAGARALAFPSLYEGFGLPVVEAFLAGVPVITSAAGATAEIAGDAAVLVDPLDVRAIRDALRAFEGEGADALRARCVARGRRRAADFAEAAVAARLDAFYRSLAR